MTCWCCKAEIAYVSNKGGDRFFAAPCECATNTSSPCLACAKCKECCGCKEALVAKAGGRMGLAVKAKPEPWTCPRCGKQAEMELLHGIEGCGGGQCP